MHPTFFFTVRDIKEIPFESYLYFLTVSLYSSEDSMSVSELSSRSLDLPPKTFFDLDIPIYVFLRIREVGGTPFRKIYHSIGVEYFLSAGTYKYDTS